MAAAAQGGVWTSSGPEGGPVVAIVFDPVTSSGLWAGTLHNGVFRSTDGGATWSAANAGGPREIYELAIAGDGTLWAIGERDEPGVFRSSDGGASWQEMLAQDATALAVDPTSPGTVYAAVFELGVFKTTDGGANWTSSASGLGLVIGVRLAVDPLTPATLYLGTQSESVYKSTDAGVTWSKADTGIEDVGILSLVIDPLAPATIYAATQEGLFKTTNSAAAWNPVATPPPAAVEVVAVDPAVSGTLWAGGFGRVFRSTDGGASWSEPSTAIPKVDVHALAVDPATSSTVYAGTGAGPVKTTDDGATWAAINGGLRSVMIDRLAVDPAAPDTLYAVSPESGVYKSTDGGGSWQPVNSGIANRLVQDLALAASQPQTLFAAQPRGLRETADGAATWTDPVTDTSAFGLIGPVIDSLQVDPASPANVLAGHVGAAFLGGGPGIYRSTDGAATWTRVFEPGLNGPRMGEIRFNPSLPSEAIAALDGNQLGVIPRRAALLLSTDGGATWMETLRQDGSGPVPVAWDPFDSDTAYSVLSPGDAFEALRSSDGGATWAPFAVTAPCLNDLLPDPRTAGTLWAACEPAFVSDDGGAGWSAFDATGFPTGIGGALTLELAQGSLPRLHAGTEIGVYSYAFPGLADLAVTKTSAGGEFADSDPLDYDIVVSNLGPEDAFDVRIEDPLPAGVDCAAWTCIPSGGATCDEPPPGDLDELVDLPAGGAVTLTGSCVVGPGASGLLVNTVTVTAPEDREDPDLANNTATETDVVPETGACGEPDDRILSGVVLDTPQSIEACNSITVESATIAAAVDFTAPLVSIFEIAVETAATLTIFDDVP